MRILIADDELGTRLLIAAAVEQLGHEPIVADDGIAAWQLFLAESPEVVITDWEMPGLNGTDLIARIRGEAGVPYAYLIMLTGRADEAAARATMHAGADDLILKPLDPADLERRLISAERVIGLHATLADDARHDPLTGLGNRRRLDEDLTALIARAERYGHRFALALLDIDRFKAFNDRAGHLVGDEALRRVAHGLQATLRSGDSIYRYGGEEFAVLLPEQSPETAVVAAERLRATVAKLSLPHSAGGCLTISVGLAMAEPPVFDPIALFGAADAALYRAKSEGRDRVVFHLPGATSAQPGRPVRLLVADHHPGAIELLAAIAEQAPDLELVDAATDGHAAIERALETRPDVVLLDVDLPGRDGAQAADAIRTQLPSSRILAYSAEDGPEMQLAMARAGAVGYILKGTPADEIVRAIASAARW